MVTSSWANRAPIAGEMSTLHTAFSQPGSVLGTKPLGVSKAYFSLTTLRVNPNNSVIYRFHQLPDGLGNDFSIFENRFPAQNGPHHFPCQCASSVRRLLVTIEKLLRF